MTVAGGTARVTTVSSGGEMSATSGGIVSNTTVKAGSMYLDGNVSASSTVLSGMDFQSGGKIVAVQAVMNIINAAVFSTTVSSGGNMTVSAYSGTTTATNTTVNSGENMTVAYGSATDTTVSSGGKLTAVNATVGCGK